MASTPSTILQNDSDLTLGEVWNFLLPRLATDTSPPIWPPDMFALTMGVIARWGIHARALENWPPPGVSAAEWSKRARELGKIWRTKWNSGITDGATWWQSDPELAGIYAKWQDMLLLSGKSAASFAKPSGAADAAKILELSAIADEACAGMGIAFEQQSLPTTATMSPSDLFNDQVREFYYRSERRLIVTRPKGASLCEELSPSRCRVLPKMHTPASGMTVRSLSHNLCVLESCEIKPAWAIPDKFQGGNHLNLLFIPVPMKINPSDFRPVGETNSGEMKNMSKEHFGFFSYSPEFSDQLTPERLEKLVQVAEKNIGRIHAIVMPELALTEKEFARLTRAFFELPLPSSDMSPMKDADGRGPRAFVIAGVRSPENDSINPLRGRNQVVFAYGRRNDPNDLSVESRQSKHHRWKLESNQIRQYGLGSRLDPVREWWEHIGVCDRSLIFHSLQPWLVMSVLICEDLARPDPVGDLIRAVGPNLVIALLMDGPQTKERWSARYATTLADDPGSSVLSITSLGMSSLSRPHPGTTPRNRVVGLWKEAKSGSLTEIELPPTAEAIVLTLTRRYGREWTADGRSNNGGGFPELNGLHPINTTGIV